MNFSMPHIETLKKQEIIHLVLSGRWLTRNLRTIESKLDIEPLNLKQGHKVHLEFNSTFSADTAGCWIVAKFLKKLKEHNITFTVENHPHYIDELLDKNLTIKPESELSGWLQFLEDLGKRTAEVAQKGRQLIGFLGEVLVTIYRSVRTIKCLRWASIVHHLQVVGLQAIPITGMISLLIGAVLAYQGIIQLDKFGASIYTIDFLGIALLREISVLLTSVVVAGRSGSSFTAEIGTMSLNQEIDAIRVLGLNPIIVLVVPRVLALLVALPILVMFSMLTGALGGMVLTSLLIDVTPMQFWQSLHKAVTISTFWVGMSKAPLFAIIISIVGCFRGFQVKGSAESIGLMTTKAVVEAIFLVIICDGLMSIVYTAMGI